MKPRFLITLIVTLMLISMNPTQAAPTPNQTPEWIDALVIGDAYRIEFYHQQLQEIKTDYGLDAQHNAVQSWIDYRPWMEYPHVWTENTEFNNIAKTQQIGIGAATGFTPTDATNGAQNDSLGFSHLYNQLPEDEKWKDPTGNIVDDPYESSVTRSYSDYQVWRQYSDQDSGAVMQTQNPYWTNYLVDWSKEIIDTGSEGIMYDNVDMIFPPFYSGGFGDQTTWEGQAFTQYLSKKYTPTQLTTLRINLDTFNITDYMTTKFGLDETYPELHTMRETWQYTYPGETLQFNTHPQEIISDPIIKDWLIYQYRQMNSFTQTLTNQVKTYAAQKNQPVILSTNNYENWLPHLAVTPYFDVNYIEKNNFQLPPYSNNVATAKRGLATVNHQKPVWISEWIMNFCDAFNPYPEPDDYSNLIKIRAAETYASGAIMLVPFGSTDPDKDWPPQELVTGEERENVAPVYKWISQNQAIFKDTKPEAKTAIIYSIPTAVWNYFPAIELSYENYYNDVNGWTRALEFNQIPYDVILLGHPDIFNDTTTNEKLSKYDTLLIPGCESISTKHLDMLETISQNTTIIVDREFATHDEYWNPIEKPDWTSENTQRASTNLGLDLTESLMESKIDQDALDKLTETLENSIINTSKITITGDTNLNTLYTNTMKKQKTLILHIVNTDYSYDYKKDYITPKENLTITIYNPDYNETTIKHIKPNSETENIPITTKKGWISFNISSIDYWSIIVFEPQQPVTYTNLDLDTQTATPDQEITITLTIYNPNTDTTKHTPSILIDENQLEIETITIPGKETATITRKIQLKEGSHTISADNKEKQITIQTPEEPEIEQETEEEPEPNTDPQQKEETQKNSIPGYEKITIILAIIGWTVYQKKQSHLNIIPK